MAYTEIILREKIENLGAEADVVKVKAGYARNFLIPSGKAYEATRGNLRKLESLKQARAAREAEELQDATSLASKIKKTRLNFTLETGQGGKAFGSVTSMDIHQKLSEAGFEVDRHKIELSKAIKSTGTYDVEIKLHPDVAAAVTVNVHAAEEEAAG